MQNLIDTAKITTFLEQQLNEYFTAETARKEEIFNCLKNMIENINNSCRSSVFIKEKFLQRRVLQRVYTSTDCALISLFETHLPTPPLSIFEPENIPEWILKKDFENKALLNSFAKQNTNDQSLETKVIYIQRHIRQLNRQNSEVERIGKRHHKAPIEARLCMEKGSQIYRPGPLCPPALADRILVTVEQIKLYSTITHITSTKNIAAILDECIYGRENLVNKCLDFIGAVLDDGDVDDGDANVICCGPAEIDSKCLTGGNIGLEFDLDKIIVNSGLQKNPSAFFKQQDFGYVIKAYRSINLAGRELLFQRFGESLKSQLFCLEICEDEFSCVATLPKYEFISYNTEKIHQILVMNFFKLVDVLNDETQALSIYRDIENLNDDELQKFLIELGRSFSKTCEFNFYGAHKIDFETLIAFKVYKRYLPKRITMHDLLTSLHSGRVDVLTELLTSCPQLVNSQRLMAFLASKVSQWTTLFSQIDLPKLQTK